jgi:hypothetical protein
LIHDENASGTKSRADPGKPAGRPFLYAHIFHNQLAPLIIVSAASTALIFVFVPLLRLGDKPTGVAAS